MQIIEKGKFLMKMMQMIEKVMYELKKGTFHL